ncbi:MAG: ABC transporter permease, partial [Treponema sp.]|nr:ABC transporter permease [Treponema sp.]
MKFRPGTEHYLGIFLLVLLLVLLVFAPGFFNLNNTMSMLNRFSYVLIAAIGMTMIIITSNIDVSAGNLISVVCLAIAALGKAGFGLVVLLPVAIVLGALLSLVNALFIT